MALALANSSRRSLGLARYPLLAPPPRHLGRIAIAWPPPLLRPQHGLLAGGTHDASCPPRGARRFAATRRKLPPSVMVTERAAERIAHMLGAASGSPAAVRLGIENDWGSHTGFSYTLSFVDADSISKDDEKIELSPAALLVVERKAIWAGEGGLLGATLDIDDAFALIVTPKEPRSSGYS